MIIVGLFFCSKVKLLNGNMVVLYKKFYWTQHSQIKMRQYGLSKQKLMGILRKPERKEKGIVPGTVAVMKTNKVFFGEKKITLAKAWQKPKRAPGEIWLMFKDVKKQGEGNIRKIISAWRYPGISKPGEAIPIPDDILQALKNNDFE
ncbi:MAG: hypothetical protein Q8Q48_00390 [Candidatus Staskawiczbacteria bacterium]|nr:hypothetical protein [Candidatus Staskawiczbacteria bacterium]